MCLCRGGIGGSSFSNAALSVDIVRDPEDRGEASLDVIVASCPRRDADAHRSPAAPPRRSAPAGPVVLHAADHVHRVAIVAECYEHLIEDYVVENLLAGLAQPGGESPGLAAVAVHAPLDPVAPQTRDRRPHFVSGQFGPWLRDRNQCDGGS